MSRAGYEPASPATKRPQTYALDRAATGLGRVYIHTNIIRDNKKITSSKSPAVTEENYDNLGQSTYRCKL
jgi:hypothetical protein